jgi:ophiobolin F synthase
MRAFWPMVEFSMGWSPSDGEKLAMAPIFEPIEEALILTNDYWSWDREYEESMTCGNRLVNAVGVVAQVSNLEYPEAKRWVQDRIVACEQLYVHRKAEFYSRHPVTVEVRRWIEQAGCILSGSHYWASACARHYNWKEYRKRAQQRLHDSSLERSTEAVLNNPGAPEVRTSRPQKRKREDSHGPWATKTEWKRPDGRPLMGPVDYIRSLPSKGVRSMLIEAFNLWLNVARPSLAIIEKLISDLHNASLVLDDIEDDSHLQRDKLATHTVFGAAQAINSANFMFIDTVGNAQQLQSPGALKVLLEGLECLYRGQALDIYWKFHMACPSESEYMVMIENKTGGLFRMLL